MCFFLPNSNNRRLPSEKQHDSLLFSQPMFSFSKLSRQNLETLQNIFREEGRGLQGGEKEDSIQMQKPLPELDIHSFSQPSQQLYIFSDIGEETPLLLFRFNANLCIQNYLQPIVAMWQKTNQADITCVQPRAPCFVYYCLNYPCSRTLQKVRMVNQATSWSSFSKEDSCSL